MINPTEADIGRRVVYRSRGGDVVEAGRITSFNGSYVFVCFCGEFFSKACKRSDLEWIDTDTARQLGLAHGRQCASSIDYWSVRRTRLFETGEQIEAYLEGRRQGAEEALGRPLLAP